MIIRLFLVLAFTSALSVCRAQEDPVRWSFSGEKIADGTYQVTFKARVEQPWHIYSQFTPDGGPVPTKISFDKNPIVQLKGAIKESGKLVQKLDDVFGVEVKYFDGDASFIQTVKLKAGVNTRISGSIEFMACNEEQCLAPTTIPFSVALK